MLTLLLTGFLTFTRPQDLRQEQGLAGQLIANQLAPATEYGVINGKLDTLEIPLPFRPCSTQAPDRDGQPLTGGNGQAVLLVEDNPVKQTVTEAMLRSLGYPVSLAGDGQQAVQNGRAQDYAAILMDCRLPLMDGYEATRQIRQLEGRQQLPIIALTANALQGDREACLAAGMNDYLAKPFKRADLQRILQRWLPSRP